VPDVKPPSQAISSFDHLPFAIGHRSFVIAPRLYGDSLDIAQQLRDRAGVAQTLHQLGMLAEEDSDLKEAERLFAESLATLEALHSPDAAVARRSLQRVRDRLERKSH
jgi:hypothetical protein